MEPLFTPSKIKIGDTIMVEGVRYIAVRDLGRRGTLIAPLWQTIWHGLGWAILLVAFCATMFGYLWLGSM